MSTINETYTYNNFDMLVDKMLPIMTNVPPLTRCDAMPTNNLRPPTPVSPQLNKTMNISTCEINNKFEGLFHNVSYKMQTPHMNQSIIIKREFIDPGFDPFNHYYVTDIMCKNSQCDIFQIQLDDDISPNPVLNVGIICGEWKVLNFRFFHSVHFA
jgi:hypothetical protein